MQNSKRKTFGKLLVVALFVMLFALVLTVSVGAEATTHNVATETELTTALTNAANGDTINVTANITLTEAITLNKQLIIKGNGCTLSRDGAEVIYLASTVEINDLSVSGKRPFVVSSGNTANLTYTGGTLTATDRVFHTEGALTATVSGTAAAPVTMNTAHAICAEGSGVSNVELGANVSVNASQYFCHFSKSSSGTTTVNGATIQCGLKGLYTNASGQVNFVFNSGSLTSGDYIAQYEGSAAGKVTIAGGTLENTKAGSQGLVNTGSGAMNLDISGGSVIAPAQPLWYSAGGGGTINISGSPTISGSYWNLGNDSCTGRIELNLGGSPTMNFSVDNDGIRLTAKTAGKITISGTWTTDKAICFGNAAHEVEVVGNDTNVSLGMFYAYSNSITVNVKAGTVASTRDALVSGNDGSGATLNISGGTVNAGKYLVRPYGTSAFGVTVSAGTVTSKDHMFLAGDTSTINATVTGGNLSATGSMIYADGKPTVNLTVSGSSQLSSEYWFAQYITGAKGSLTYNGGEIDASTTHHIVNFGYGKVDLTMTAGTLRTKDSTIYYENKTSTDATKSKISITGGQVIGSYFNIDKTSNVDIEIGGTANVQITANNSIYYHNDATGNVTIGGSAIVTLTATEQCIFYDGKAAGNVTIGGTATVTLTGTQGIYYTSSATSIEHSVAGVVSKVAGIVTINDQATVTASSFLFRTRSTANAVLTINGCKNVTATGHLVVNGDTSKSTVILNGGTVKAGGNMVIAAGSVDVDLIVNGGSLTSTDYFAYYAENATGSITIGGNATVSTTNGIFSCTANTDADLTIQGSAVCTFSAKNGIEINGASPTVTIQGSATIESEATVDNIEVIYAYGGANPIIYIKGNATILTPDNKWGHAIRVGDTKGETPATATIYIQGSTVAGEEGVDIDTARILDLRQKSSAALNISGTVNLNADCGLVFSPGAVKAEVIFDENTDATLVAGAETFFSMTAATSTLKLNGTINATGNVDFVGLDGGITDPVIELKGNYTLNTGNFIHVISVKKSDGAEAVKIDVTGNLTGTVANIIYANNTGTTPVDINIAANINITVNINNGNGVYVENSSAGLFDIDITAREGNATDKFVLNGWRAFNFRANTNVDLCINTNEINVTTSERIGYTTGAACVKVELLAPKATYTTGGNDHFILCNGGANGDVTLKLTGIASLTTPATLVSFIAVNASNDVSITIEMTDDCPAYSLAGKKHNDGNYRPVMDLAYNTTGNFTVSMKGKYTFTGFTDFFTFYNSTGTVDVDLTGDFTYQGSDQFFCADKVASADVDLTGNFNFQSYTVFWVKNTVSGLCSLTVQPREGNTTDAFNFSGWRLTNIRENTTTDITLKAKGTITTTGCINYHVGVKSVKWDVVGDGLVMNNGDDSLWRVNGDSGTIDIDVSGDVQINSTMQIVYITKGATTVDISGNVQINCSGQSVFYVEGNSTCAITIDGADDSATDTGFVVTTCYRLTNIRAGVTGSVTITGKADVTATEKVMYHVDNAINVTLNGDITMTTPAADWIIATNCDDASHDHSTTTSNINILGNTKLIGTSATAGVQANGNRTVNVTVGGNAEIRVAGKSVWLYNGASGSLTIQDSAKLSGDQIRLEGSGELDLTIKGTPTIVTTTQYNGIQHKATGEGQITLSGVWSTNKTIYFSGGKKVVEINGADTNISIGGSGIYAEGCVMEITVAEGTGTVNSTGGDGLFTAVSGGSIKATINGGNLSAKKYFGHAYHNGCSLDLTVNNGILSSGSWFLYYGKNKEKSQTATGTVIFNNGEIKSVDHMVVNFGSGKVDFTVNGGSVSAPASFIYYENQTSYEDPTKAEVPKSTVTVNGGVHDTSSLYVFKMSNVDIIIDGTAQMDLTPTMKDVWGITYKDNATGSVTLKGNAKVTCSTHCFVNNGSNKVDFTIQDKASLSTTANTTIYYGGTFPADVVNEVNIKGGSINAAGQAITFPGSGKFNLNISSGSVFANGDSIALGGTFNGQVTISDGTLTSNTNGLYVNCNGTVTINISGGSIIANANDCIEVFNNDSLKVNMTISGGTLHGKKMDLQYGSGYPLTFSGKNNTLTVTGGNFIADYAHAALMVAGNATANIYGGYLEAGALCCARATEGGTLNIYGGTFYYTGTTSSGGMPVRSGTGSAVGNVNIYGGNYYTDGTGTIFCCMNGVSNMTLYGGFNAFGGRGLVESANSSSIKSSGHGIGDMWTYRSIRMATGAAVRIVDGSTGLRFKGIISAADYAHIASVADAGSISFGTLIAPVDYVQQVRFFTEEALKAAKLSYLNIPAANGLHELEDGSYEIWAALTNIKEANLDREFAAVCYVTYTVDEQEVTVYANYRETKNARSIRQVARLALQDDGRYNSNQIAVLQTLAPEGKAPVIDLYLIAGQSNAAGSTIFSEDFRNSNQDFVDGYSNIYYSGTAAGGTAFASKNFVEVDLVKAGYGGNKTYGMGAELGMAKALSQYYNEETGRTAAIVKYGYGGTALADTISGQNYPEGSWTSPSWLADHGKKDEYKSGGLYRAFVKQIESSISDYRAMGYDVNIVAAYWMQGESDRTNANYAAMFEAWVNDLRADVYALTGNADDQSLPVLVGEISYSYNPGNMNLNPAFIAMQNEMANNIDNLYIINQSPLATANTRSDTGHWSCDDMLLIGEMIATTALNELVLDANTTKYEMPYLTGTPVAEVYDAEGTLIDTYSSFSWAINTAPTGATVKLLSDLTIYGPLGICNPNKITVDGQNYKIDVKTTEGDAMKLIATDIVLNNFNIKNHSTTQWGLQTYQNAKFIWNGGSFEAESIGIVMNDTSVGQLHNVTVSVRNGVEGHSAAIYMGNQNADIWVDNCTVTAYGKAEAIRALNGYVTVTGNSVITGGADTAYAISQRSLDGYMTIEDGVVVNGVIVNNGYGSNMNEDVVDLPDPVEEENPAA